MADACAALEVDVAVMAAAVADFRPALVADSKLARNDGPPEISLVKTPDILATMVARARPPFVVGFAAETGDLARAVEKAARKGVDLMVANDVTEKGAGFAVDTNKVTIVFPGGKTEQWPQLPKTEVAARLWDLIGSQLVQLAR
jgi:phosphopantothenoylcysteine decarboxylase/phosphopantothenate--cysteine ligase